MDKPTEAAAAPAPEKKPRKPRTPPAPPDVEPIEDEIDPNDPWMGEKPPKHYVLQMGSEVTLSGKDVKLRPLTHELSVDHGIKQVIGAQGEPCVQPLIIKFKSPAAAEKFFDLCLHAEEEEDEHIQAGNRTEWVRPDIMDGF